jgi:protein NrfD
MPPDFNPSFVIPHWGWWIVLYFFIGGITGGVYFAAAFLDLFGEARDRPAVRLGHLLAFPLILLSAIVLIVDLGQPLRFWHMIFESERFPLPIFKWYSPMSFGSLVLFVFGVVVFVSFLDAAFGGGNWWHGPGNPIGKAISAIGAIGGVTFAGYTGVVLNVSNEPVWGNSPWISALFLFSGVSTGMALLMLLAPRFNASTSEKLSEADNYLMLLELLTLVIFLVSLGAIGVGARFIFASPVLILFVVVVLIGLLVPLALHLRPALAGGLRTATTLAAVLVLVGGFVLRWAILAAPQGIGM